MKLKYKIGIVTTVFIALAVVLYFNSRLYEYHKAKSLFQDGNFHVAATAFHVLSDYKDSHDMYLLTMYSIADQYYKEGDLDAAVAGFQALDEYSDSECRVDTVTYEIAMGLYNEARYTQAAGMFSGLGDFADAYEMTSLSYYNHAQELYTNGHILDAVNVLNGIAVYRDSQELSNQYLYEYAEVCLSIGDTAQAVSSFQALGSYSDAPMQFREIGYLHANGMITSGDMHAAVALLRSIGDYRDSQLLVSNIVDGWYRFLLHDTHILDSQTGLHWQVGKDSTTTWFRAADWVTSLGGDWRMPSRNELDELNSAGVSTDDWGYFENSGEYVWTGEIKEYAPSAFLFKFNRGYSGYNYKADPDCNYYDYRAFAVYDPSDTSTVDVYTVVPSIHSERFHLTGGVILDTETTLEWRVGPDYNTSWYNAKRWVDNLGGTWRMPTVEELLELTDAGIENSEWGPFYVTAYNVWSGEQWWRREGDNQPSDGWYVCFFTGTDSRTDLYATQSWTDGFRVFAVREQ